jgi:hypothetical protein
LLCGRCKYLQNALFLIRARVEGTPETLLCSPLSTAKEGAGRSVEHQIELTAESLWDEVSSRLRGALNEATFGTWFGDAAGASLTDDAFALAFRTTSRGSGSRVTFLGLIRAAVKDATGMNAAST